MTNSGIVQKTERRCKFLTNFHEIFCRKHFLFGKHWLVHKVKQITFLPIHVNWPFRQVNLIFRLAYIQVEFSQLLAGLIGILPQKIVFVYETLNFWFWILVPYKFNCKLLVSLYLILVQNLQFVLWRWSAFLFLSYLQNRVYNPSFLFNLFYKGLTSFYHALVLNIIIILALRNILQKYDSVG
jgi:hypothetical protein